MTEARGLATHPARGSTPAPFFLENALLGAGGWACAPAAKRAWPEDLATAIWAGEGRNFYAQRANGEVFFVGDNVQYAVPLPPNHFALSSAVRLGPNILQLGEDYLVREKVVGHTPTVSEWVTGQPQPSGPYFKLLGAISPTPTTYRIVPIQGAGRVGPAHPYTLPLTLHLPDAATFGNFPYHVQIYEVVSAGPPAVLQYRFTNAVTYNGTVYSLTTPGMQVANPGQPNLVNTAQNNEHMVANMLLAEYHQGRVFYTASYVKVGMSQGEMVTSTSPTNRLYFSDVSASFDENVVPSLASDYYFDIPFRVSRNITALKSGGRYLYVFGENELLILSGSDDSNWQLESLGEGIGTRAADTVQSIRGAMVYLGEGDVFLVRGGEVKPVGFPVRDLLVKLAPDPGQLTATVDFERGLYYLSDMRTVLMLHLETQEWSTRTVEGDQQRLLYMGGLPYAYFGTGLYALTGPALLPLTVKIGPFGTAGWRHTWRGVAAAVDTDQPAALTVQVRGLDTDLDEQPVATLSAQLERAAHADELTPTVCSFQADTAALVSVAMRLTPDPLSRRCILRPPVTVAGDGRKEAWA